MPVLLRPVQDADYDRIVAIMNGQARVPISVAEYRRQDSLMPEGMKFLKLVAEADGFLAGVAMAGAGSLLRPGQVKAQVRVDRSWRNRGVGRALYAAVEDWARAQGGDRIESSVDERYPADLAWTERRGYAVDQHLFGSTRSLPDFDPEPFAPVLEAVRASGIRFSSLDREMRGEETLRRFWKFEQELGAHVPAAEQQPDVPFELWREAMVESPYWNPGGIILGLDGERWVGLSEVIRIEGVWHNSLTGVCREYRGKGLGLALKVTALLWAREQGALSIRTENHSGNGPMLAVNRRLGYQPEPGLFTLYKLLV